MDWGGRNSKTEHHKKKKAKKKQKDTENKIKTVHMIHTMVLGNIKHESVSLFTSIFVMLKLEISYP